MRITLSTSDVTERHVDALVTAANSALLPGGRVGAATRLRGGPVAFARALWSVPG